MTLISEPGVTAEPVLTAKEKAVALSKREWSKTQGPRPPIDPLPNFEPSSAVVAKWTSILGHNPENGLSRARSEAKRCFPLLAKIIPDTAEEIEAQIAAMVAARDLASSLLFDGHGAILAAQNLLKDKAAWSGELAQLVGQLASVNATLDSPAILDLPSDQQVKLTLEAKHLPTRIEEKESKITEVVAVIKTQCEALGVSAQTLIDDIRDQAITGDQRETRRLLDGGHFDM